jgi:delta14-sterol reductase
MLIGTALQSHPLQHGRPRNTDPATFVIAGRDSVAGRDHTSYSYCAGLLMVSIVPESPELLGSPPVSKGATASNVVLTLFMLLTLPLLVYYIWICLAFNHGQLRWPSVQMLEHFPLPTPTSVGIVAGWLTFQGLLQIYAPGKWVEGPSLADGSRLKYKMNGWFAWWFTWATLGAGVAMQVISPTILADQFGPLLTTANIFTYLFCFYLYWHGKKFRTKHERVTNNAIYDFWLGTALNPRVLGFDLKLFCESRPGLIAWVALDFSLAAKQHELHGVMTVPMLLVCAFHFWYVADYYLHEKAILTTWDIKHENFGWMLCWGDLVWVPFTYTIQAYYLVEHTRDLPWWGVVGIVLLNLAGYVIFRGSNNQKYQFRQTPGNPIWGKPARHIKTARGSLLLTSGWWGLSRHMNYFGDLLMGLAWCLPCLFDSALPYFYITYFTILLVHRERRDHQMCAARYGGDWDAYCTQVHYRIIPGVY